MHQIVQNLINIEKKIKSSLSDLNVNNQTKIIAVSKTFKLDKILPLIDYGHLHYGENKVQEALDKWVLLKEKKPEINLHLIGKLQTNKVKYAVKLFNYIHSVDSFKLAKKISEEELKVKKKINVFIQVNIGDEIQKSGVKKKDLSDLVSYCRELKLNLLGLMCIPPIDVDPNFYFNEMTKLNKIYGFKELSMGMSSDYLDAAKHLATYLRIGSSIFGPRS